MRTWWAEKSFEKAENIVRHPVSGLRETWWTCLHWCQKQCTFRGRSWGAVWNRRWNRLHGRWVHVQRKGLEPLRIIPAAIQRGSNLLPEASFLKLFPWNLYQTQKAHWKVTGSSLVRLRRLEDYCPLSHPAPLQFRDSQEDKAGCLRSSNATYISKKFRGHLSDHHFWSIYYNVPSPTRLGFCFPPASFC